MFKELPKIDIYADRKRPSIEQNSLIKKNTDDNNEKNQSDAGFPINGSIKNIT